MDGLDGSLLYGRLHPLVLHFPIALLLTAAVIEALSLKVRASWLRHSGLALLASGAVSALVAASMGYTLAVADGHTGEVVTRHRLLGLSVAGFALLALLLRLRLDRGQRVGPAYAFTLGICVVAVFGAGHFGGELTHGRDFLAEAVSPIITSLTGRPTQARMGLAGDLYVEKIEPILSRHCFSCHDEAKRKGGLRLDLRAEALAGGDSGQPAIVPGDIGKSALVQRLFLSREDEKAMPPDGRERPDAEAIVALIDWIAVGAPWAGGSVGPTRILADLLVEGVEDPPEAAMSRLRATGALVEPLSRDNPLLHVNFAGVTASSAEIVNALAPVLDVVTWLDLSGHTLDEGLLQSLETMTRLTSLTLANAGGIDDDALEQLANIETLYRLNLIGTDVSAAGLRALSDCPNLSEIYLWRTAVTGADIEELRADFPNTDIHLGATLVEPGPTEDDRG